MFRTGSERQRADGENHMRAALMRNKKIVTADIPSPEPGPGEVLVKSLACGICGSDLHALRFADKLVDGGAHHGLRPPSTLSPTAPRK